MFVFSESLLHDYDKVKQWGIILYKLSDYKLNYATFGIINVLNYATFAQ